MSDSSQTGREPNEMMHRATLTALSAIGAGILTEVIFYGLDSYKVMKQAAEPIRMSRLFKGVVPLSVLGSGPYFGTFFICYNPIRNTFDDKFGRGFESTSVLLASVFSAVPASILAVPADVIKKNLMLMGKESLQKTSISNGANNINMSRVASHIYRSSGLSGFFLGWQANVLRDVPFAAIKMSLYEGLARLYLTLKRPADDDSVAAIRFSGSSSGNKNHSSFATGSTSGGTGSRLNADALDKWESAQVGFASGVCTAVLTNPIDCVNTRIKSGELSHLGMASAHREIVRRDGWRALFRGLAPRSVVLGLGSTVFWYLQVLMLNAMDGDNGKHSGGLH
jgi:predicted membrane protein